MFRSVESLVRSFRYFLLLAALATANPLSAWAGVFSNTGADNCNNATVLPVPIGPPGSPQSITVTGNNTGATGPDCTTTAGAAVWWEAFEITDCAIVSIDLCGTTPVQDPSYFFIQTGCPPSGQTDCGVRIFPASSGRGAPPCAENNAWMTFVNLPAGVYYYPVRSINPGPYQIHFTAESCVGACCHLDDGTCTDGADAATCNGPNDLLRLGESCCESECLPPGETFARAGMEMLSWVPIGQFPGSSGSGNDVWGYTSPSGREYAFIGLNQTTGVVEITYPTNPEIVADLSDFGCFWSDIKVYLNYMYNVTDCGGGLQVFDLARIDEGIIPLVTTYTGFGDSHTLTLNPDSGYAYLNGSNIQGGTLIAVSLADPRAPAIVAGGAWKSGICSAGASAGQPCLTTSNCVPGPNVFCDYIYVHDSQVVSYTSGPYAGKEIAFLYCGGAGLYIADVTNKSDMHTIGHMTYPTLGYCHQGWLNDARTHIYMNDEADEGFTVSTATTYVINVEDLTNPFLVTAYEDGICHIDHDLIIQGNMMYKASYTHGLVVDDISNPNAPVQRAYFDTFPEGNFFGFDGVWGSFVGYPSGIAVASDINRGLFVLNYDCNQNGIDDTDDIALGTSDDCNANGLPDECEYDCDNNGIPDLCDLADGAVDADGDGFLDACDCSLVVPALPEPTPIDKNRYLSLVPGNDGHPVGIRVRLLSVDRFGGFNGQVRWVGPPQTHPDVSTGSTFIAAPLQCTPHYMDWGSINLLHVYGAEIAPNSSYEIQLIHEQCPGGILVESNYTAALPVLTAKWGDILAPFGGVSQPNFGDISGVVDAFRTLATAPRKARAQLQPNVPNPAGAISFQDISYDVEGFRGLLYPLIGPANCQ